MELEDALSEFEPEERNWITMAEIRLSGLNRLSEVGRRLSWRSDRTQFLFIPQFETTKARKLLRHLSIIRQEIAELEQRTRPDMAPEHQPPQPEDDAVALKPQRAPTGTALPLEKDEKGTKVGSVWWRLSEYHQKESRSLIGSFRQ
jgi:hypothetical protein